MMFTNLIKEGFLDVSDQCPLCSSNLFYLKKSHEHYFIYDADLSSTYLNLANMISLHKDIRKFVNSLYKLPKILRVKYPNIVLIVCGTNIPADLIDYVQKNSFSTAIGGESTSIFLVDFANSTIHSYGKRETTLGHPGSGSKITFNDIDPKNRSYNVVHRVFSPMNETELSSKDI